MRGIRRKAAVVGLAVGALLGGTVAAALASSAVTSQAPGGGQGVERSTEGCPEGRTYRNHGEYVSEVEAAGGDVEAAARSDCGKPVHARQGQGEGAGGDEAAPGGGQGGPPPGAGQPRDPHPDDPCKGPPPWAGRAGKAISPEQKAQMQAERAAACGTGEDESEAEGGAPGASEAPGAPEAPELPEAPPEATPPAEPPAEPPASPPGTGLPGQSGDTGPPGGSGGPPADGAARGGLSGH